MMQTITRAIIVVTCLVLLATDCWSSTSTSSTATTTPSMATNTTMSSTTMSSATMASKTMASTTMASTDHSDQTTTSGASGTYTTHVTSLIMSGLVSAMMLQLLR